MTEKRRELSEFERGRLVGARDAGMSLGAIGERYDVPKSTVRDVIKAFEEQGSTKPQPRSGRPKLLDDRDKRHLIQIVKSDHKVPLSKITAETKEAISISISESTIRRALHSQGYHGRVGLRKPFINEKNRLKRLKWSTERSDWDDEWDWIIWSDESKFELTGSHRRQWVWCRPEQKMDVDCLVPTF